jgi:integrase
MKTVKEIRHSIRTYIHGYNVKRNNGVTGKVEIRVRWAGSREIVLYSGYYAESYKWDAANQLCIRNTTHNNHGERISASKINHKIMEIVAAVNDSFTDFAVNDKAAYDIESQDLKDAIYKRIGLSKSDINVRKRRAHEKVEENDYSGKTFFQIFDDFVNDGMLGGWREDTKKKLTTLRNRLFDFDPRLSLSKLNEDKVVEFANWLVNDFHYHNVSVQASIKNFRWFMRWCEKKDLIHDRNVINYRTKLKDVEDKTVVFLDWDEFQQLYNYQVPKSKQYLQRTKDVFIFQCTTGLRYADLANLKHSNIQKDQIFLVTSKTALKTVIDLNKYSKEIIDKYKDVKFEGGNALPVPSNQKYNDYLKELAHLAGLTNKILIAYRTGNQTYTEEVEKWQKIGSHAGRRTFVSIGLALGAKPEEIAKVTGHHSLKIMEKHYIGTDDKQRRHATDVWNEKSERDEYERRYGEMSLEEIKKMFALWDAQKNIS